MKEQFQRIARFIGESNVEILGTKCVSICGVGAVGGFAAEMLARSGVGHIKLFDFDTVSVTNINRQIIALHSTVGRLKVDVMKDRIQDINPECIVDAYPIKIDESNHSLIFDSDLVLDCIDSVDAKVSLLSDAYRSEVKIISSMGAALRKSIRNIRTGDIFDTTGCPLAKAVRSGLRKAGCGRGIECVYSPEPVDFNYIPPGDDPDAETEESGRKRMVLGSLPFVTAAFGEMMAELAIKKLLPNAF